MLGHTHLIIGTGSGLALALVTHQPPLQAGALALAGALGGLLPDSDSPHALIHQKLFLTRIVAFFVKHRGITHSLLATALLFVLGAKFAQMYGYAMAAGYASHLAADAMTIDGIPFLYPYGRMFHLLPPGFRLRTGGFIESLVRLAAALAVIWCVGLVLGVKSEQFLAFLR
jgi:inner membrane protein